MPAPLPELAIIGPALLPLWITRSVSSSLVACSMRTSTRLPVQTLVGSTVSVKVSQLTVSTQLDSPFAAPVPVAVPTHLPLNGACGPVTAIPPLGGFAAKLITPRTAPSPQRTKAAKTRGFKKADSEEDFFLMLFRAGLQGIYNMTGCRFRGLPSVVY